MNFMESTILWIAFLAKPGTFKNSINFSCYSKKTTGEVTLVLQMPLFVRIPGENLSED